MIWYSLIPLVWLAFALFSRWILDNPREDVEAGLIWRLCRLYARRIQHVRHIGLENLPTSRPPGPLILVSNHTSGVDPALLIAACRFEPRFIMARDMRHALAEPFWRWTNVIMVDRKSRDASGTREAVRHITQGHAVGIFPEGGIERPPKTLKPFQAGVGLLIRRTGAPVLPCIIQGAPAAATAWGSFLKRGRATIEFKPHIRYTNDQTAQEIAADLQQRYQQWTGWPIVEERGTSRE